MCVITLLCFLAFFKAGYTTAYLDCCKTVEQGSCRDVCTQLSASAGQAEQMAQLARAAMFCPHTMTSFWECAGNSLSVMREMDDFYGRPCCNLSKSRLCQEACSKALSTRDLDHQCSRSTEDTLYACLDRQEDGVKCCGKADSPDSSNCVTTCWDMYLSDTIAVPASKRHLRQHCTGRNKAVYHCVQKQTKTTRTVSRSDGDNVICCERTQNATCQSVCERVLQSDDKEGRIIEYLISACGSVDPIIPLYNCLLKYQKSQHGSQRDVDVLEIDAAKLHCCEQASSKSCGSLCVKTYDRRWTSNVEKFQQNCGYMSSPISTMESRMHGCLTEVESPCQLGCSGLPYCTNMNNRPTEHFRSCTMEADTAAREDILLWQQGVISIPNLKIPVKDINTCEPEMWKTIACVYRVMPCTKTPTPPQICMEDCMYILNKCVDVSRLPEGKQVRDFCKRLPLTGSDTCISIKNYTDEIPHPHEHRSEISQPCKSHQCGAIEYCHIHRRKCKPSKTCPHYICRKGCKMGQASDVIVPQNSNLLVPVYAAETIEPCQQYKVCHCNHRGEMGRCRDMGCVPNQHCIISPGIVKSHGEYLKADCNDCVCFAGQLVCTRRECHMPDTNNSRTQLTGIQGCTCPRVYQPVCTSNGKTYPSACIAECMGQNVYQAGSCFSLDPCKQNPCQEGFRCIVHRKVCYGHRNVPCDRYKCVSETGDCNEHEHEPVCDTRGEEFTNICLLLARQRTLAYTGHCQVNGCSTSGVVCGRNGETYIHECAALAGRTTVDYVGECRTFGVISHDADTLNITSGIECRAVVPSTCTGITPPWSVCPVCAAELRILTSDYLARIVSSAVNKGPLTIDAMLATLSDMVTVAECDVFGYLSLDGGIVILVAPVTTHPTSLQVQACMKEAERFEYLILSRSPTFTSHMLLTPMLYAPLRTSQLSGTSAACSVHLSLMVISIVLLTHFTHKMLGYL